MSRWFSPATEEAPIMGGFQVSNTCSPERQLIALVDTPNW